MRKAIVDSAAALVATGGPLIGDVLEDFIDLALDGVPEDVASDNPHIAGNPHI